MKRTILTLVLVPFLAILGLASSKPKTLSELRYAGTIPQTSWETCGAAALATLHRLFGLEATEGEMLEGALRHQQGLDGGLNALSLVRASGERGLPLRGYRMDLQGLQTYFARGGLPVILHVTRPELHWVVGVVLVGEHLVLADPSWGRRILPLPAVAGEKGWSGVVLVPEPPLLLVPRGRAAQGEWAAWAQARLQRLEALGGRLP
ncbi:C39 family peptidase [Thermus brockianus]